MVSSTQKKGATVVVKRSTSRDGEKLLVCLQVAVYIL